MCLSNYWGLSSTVWGIMGNRLRGRAGPGSKRSQASWISASVALRPTRPSHLRFKLRHDTARPQSRFAASQADNISLLGHSRIA